MKRVIVFSLLAVLLTVLLFLGISDASISIASTNVYNNEVTTSVSETDKSDSASATITITWTTAPSPD